MSVRVCQLIPCLSAAFLTSLVGIGTFPFAKSFSENFFAASDFDAARFLGNVTGFVSLWGYARLKHTGMTLPPRSTVSI